jgi:hypothetical protein
MSDSAVLAFAGAPNQWQFALWIDASDAAIPKGSVTPINEVFVNEVTFDLSHSPSFIDLTSGFNEPWGQLGDHMVFQNSIVERGNCEHTWPPFRMGGTQLSVRGNELHNYYSRNSEITSS